MPIINYFLEKNWKLLFYNIYNSNQTLQNWQKIIQEDFPTAMYICKFEKINDYNSKQILFANEYCEKELNLENHTEITAKMKNFDLIKSE